MFQGTHVSDIGPLWPSPLKEIQMFVFVISRLDFNMGQVGLKNRVVAVCF